MFFAVRLIARVKNERSGRRTCRHGTVKLSAMCRPASLRALLIIRRYTLYKYIGVYTYEFIIYLLPIGAPRRSHDVYIILCVH